MTKKRGETSKQYVERSLREQEAMRIQHEKMKEALSRPLVKKRRMTAKERKKAQNMQERDDFLLFLKGEKDE